MTSTFVLLAGLLLPAQDAPRDAARAELGRHQGTWAVLSYMFDGKESRPEVAQSIRRIVKGDHITWERDGKPFAGTTLVLDPGQEPPALDVIPDDGPWKGKRVRGIYKFDGETLTICMANADQGRPTAFAAEPGSGHTLMVLKREKPAE